MSVDERALEKVSIAESGGDVERALDIDLGLDADDVDDPQFQTHDKLKIAVRFPTLSHRVLEDFELALHRTTKNISGSTSVFRRHVLLAAADNGMLDTVTEWDGDRIGDPFWQGKLTAKKIGEEQVPARWIWLASCVTGYIEHVKTIPPE